MQPKFVAAQKMLLNEKPSNIRKWIARFYYFRHLHLLKCVCIAHNNCMSCPSIWATLSALLINILLSFQLFLHSGSAPLLRWNNPVQRCLPVGEAALSTPEAVAACFTDRQTALMCNRRRPARIIITQSIIASASPTPSCILHRAQQHYDASACQ